MKMRSLLALALLTSVSTSSFATEACTDSYATATVIDAVRANSGIIEVLANPTSSVSIVLMDDAIYTHSTAGIDVSTSVAKNDKSIVIEQYASEIETGSTQINIETALGRLITVNIIFGEHASNTYKVVIEG